ncbi:MAG: TIR domain-containing protein [Phycisphaerales bacterium]|nr:TIR domain-containing protein [Hyphomonadaceae bacterium]
MSAARSLFISRAGVDREAGKAIASWLSAAGYKVFIQDWDLEPGVDFIAEIHARLASGDHVVALLSEAYLASPWCKMEWNAAVKAQTETGLKRLTPLRVTDCNPAGLMGLLIYDDLVGFGEEAARKRVLDLIYNLDKSPHDPGAWMTPAPHDRPKLINLDPFDLNAFAGRREELDLIHAMLGRTDAQVAITALSGLGGVGKSALARAYCELHLADYEVIWWIRSESEADLVRDLGHFAVAWNPTLAAIDDPQERALEGKNIASTWSGARPILLVFDNVLTPSLLRQYRPSGACRALVTSRNTAWSRDWNPITVRKLDPDTGAKLLIKATGIDDYAGARKLALDLDGLALPLSHAAALLRENTALTYKDVLRRYDSFMDVQTDDADVRTTFATYSVALEDLAHKSPLCRHVMSAAAYCAPEQIPASFLEAAVRTHIDNAFMDAGPVSSDRIVDALGALARYALIDVERPDEGAPSISVHRVVQRVVRRIHDTSGDGLAWGCALLHAIDRHAEIDRAAAKRHGAEALAIVPQDACAEIRAAVSKLSKEEVFGGLEFHEQVDFVSFIGRETELNRLHLLFAERGVSSVLLYGGQGVGKTAFAHSYIEKYRNDYGLVWRIDETGGDSANEQIMRHATAAGAQLRSTIPTQAAKEALDFAAQRRRAGPALIVVDDAETHSIHNWIKHRDIKFLLLSRASSIRGIDVDAQIALAQPSVTDHLKILRAHRPTTTEAEAAQITAAIGQSPSKLSRLRMMLEHDPHILFADILRALNELGPDEQPLGNMLRRQIEALPPEARDLLAALSPCLSSDIPDHFASALSNMPFKDYVAASQHLYNARLATFTNESRFGALISVVSQVLETMRHLMSPDASREALNNLLKVTLEDLPDINVPDDWPKAQTYIRHAIQALQDLEGADLLLSAKVRLYHASLLRRLGEYARVRSLLMPLTRETALEADRPALATAFTELSIVNLALGHLASAEQHARHALDKSGSQNEGPSPEGINATLAMVRVLARRGAFDEATQLLAPVLEWKRANPGEHAYELLNPLIAHAHILIDQGKVEEAQAAIDAARDIEIDDFDTRNEPAVGALLGARAMLAERRDDTTTAMDLFQQSLRVQESVHGADHPEVAQTLSHIAALETRLGLIAEADIHLRRVLGIFDVCAEHNSPVTGDAAQALALLLRHLDQTEEAWALLDKVEGGPRENDRQSITRRVDLGLTYARMRGDARTPMRVRPRLQLALFLIVAAIVLVASIIFFVW